MLKQNGLNMLRFLRVHINAIYDYKNKDANWKDSKDAIQRGMQKLRGSDPSLPPHVLKK